MTAMEEITDGMDVDIVELGTERSSKRRYVGKEEGGGRKIVAESPFSKSKTSKLSKPTLKAIKESEDGTFQPRIEGVHCDEWALTCSREPLTSLIQVVELLYHNHFRPCDGTGVIVISAGIDHALETYAVAKELLKYHSLTLGLVVGGTRRLAKHARKAANLTITTTWRLLNALCNTKRFIYENLKCLMIDVTDSSRFGKDEEIINQIKEILQKVAKVPFTKCICPRMKLEIMQKQLEKEVADNYSLHKSAEDAYKSYLSGI